MIDSLNDVSDALARSLEQDGLVLSEAQLPPAFFDLRSGFAGELMQKFVNYGARLAIVVADSSAYGERFGELIYEHRRHPSVRFFATEAQALEWLKGPVSEISS
jgi:hypothetical protein